MTEKLDVENIFYNEEGKASSYRFRESWLIDNGIKDALFEQTSFLDETYSIRERVLALREGFTEKPTCVVCGNDIHVKSDKWSQYCSHKCATTKGKFCPTKEELENLYVNECFSLSDIAKHYDVSNVTISNWFKKLEIPYEKKPQLIECPDVDLLRRLIEVDQLKFEEVAPIFGVKKHFLSTWTRRHNIVSVHKDVKIEVPPKEELEYHYIKNGLSVGDIGKIYGVSNVTATKWLVEEYKIPLRSQSDAIKLVVPKIEKTKEERHGYPHFPPDMPFIVSSTGEKELREFLNSYGFNFQPDKTLIETTSNQHTIDMYDPTAKIAIEYNGEFYHSEVNEARNKDFHVGKYKKCLEKNVRLIMINEKTEWKNTKKKKIIKSFLLAALGVFEHRVYARQCEVRKLERPNRQFLEDNHLQGSRIRLIAMYGLFYKDLMIGAVTYSPHHRKNKPITLSRLCFLSGWQCIGGAAKLIKNSIEQENFTKVITWSDNRLTDGSLYSKIGFKLEEEFAPDYQYVNKDWDIKPKQSMTKKKMGCPKEIKEEVYAKDLGYFRMWDCGKKRWVYENKKAEK